VTTLEGPTEHELIERVIQRGDQHAFSELVKRHQSILRASLRRMTNGNDALADDMSQETFILAWKNIDKFRFEARFSTWLYRIAFNCWQSDRRRKTEVLMDDDNLPEPENDAGHVDSHASQVALSRDLTRAMVDLSSAERAAIEACYFNDLSHDEAAYALNMPLGTLKSHVLRAREKMKSRLAAYAAEPNITEHFAKPKLNAPEGTRAALPKKGASR
jgi:RNA polymerase sigma-70 factor (ECF subfamily)